MATPRLPPASPKTPRSPPAAPSSPRPPAASPASAVPSQASPATTRRRPASPASPHRPLRFSGGTPPAAPKSKEELIVVFKVEAFCTIESTDRKRYAKSQFLAWRYSFDEFSLESALFELTMGIPWGPNQCATISYVDKLTREEVTLADEGQVLFLIEQCRDQGKNLLSVSIKDIGTGTIVLHNDTRADVPGPSTEPTTLEDPFDNPEEYVGVHDDAFYGQEDQQDEGDGVKKAPEEEFDGDDLDDLDIEEEVVPDDDPNEIHLSYDPENPLIEVGSPFPDMVAFKKSISHHAVLTYFEYKMLRQIRKGLLQSAR